MLAPPFVRWLSKSSISSLKIGMMMPIFIFNFLIYIFKDFIFLFIKRGEGRGKDRARNVDLLPLAGQLRIWSNPGIC